MRIVEYTPEYFDPLREAVETLGSEGPVSLGHRSFVDYFYASSDWCKLYLCMVDEKVAGTLGVLRMPLETENGPMEVGVGNNYHTVLPGSGGYLFLTWTRSNKFTLGYGGSADFHKPVQKLKWNYYSGIRNCAITPISTAYPGEPTWRVVAKRLLGAVHRGPALSQRLQRLSHEAVAEVSVREERQYTEDLLPATSPFSLRMNPTVQYLDWRYHLNLPFTRYRLFRVLRRGVTSGYVVLNDAPSRLIVAQSDGDDAMTLAYGALMSLVEVARNDKKPRDIRIMCSHPQMLEAYRDFGFKDYPDDRPFVLGPAKAALPADTSNWSVNFDWGDKGLRAPFWDEVQPSKPQITPVCEHVARRDRAARTYARLSIGS